MGGEKRGEDGDEPECARVYTKGGREAVRRVYLEE
jgi:hypothetical protein